MTFSSLSEFNYTFKWVEDGNYGFKNKETGEWNGLMGELLSQVNGYNIIFVPADNALHESTQNCLILETRGIYLFFPEVICLFHILSPELSPPKHINGQFYEILFYHIYEKLVCVGLYSLLCKLHYSSVFIFWENKMLINSGQETYNG